MVFEGGTTAAFTMNAFTKDVSRETKICGSLGELNFHYSKYHLLVQSFYVTYIIAQN